MIYVLSMGVKQLIVAVNKMDLIKYDELQYVSVKKWVLDYLIGIGYMKKWIQFVPISAYDSVNLFQKSELLDWYEGKSLYESINSLHQPTWHPETVFRMPIQKILWVWGVGTVAIGWIESGIAKMNMEVRCNEEAKS